MRSKKHQTGVQVIKIIRTGSQPAQQGLAENFTGSVQVEPLFQPHAPARTSGYLVTFDPTGQLRTDGQKPAIPMHHGI